MSAPRVHIRREYLTFEELADRWLCSMNDIRRAVLSGGLKPSFVADGIFQRTVFDVNAVPAIAIDEAGEQPITDRLQRLYFLQRPYQTGALECIFTFFSAERDASLAAAWWAVRSPMTLTEVLRDGAVMMSEVEVFEATAPATPPEKLPEEWGGHAIDQLLKLVVCMAVDAYGYEPGAQRNPAVSTIAKSISRQGQKMSDDTVRHYLRRASQAHVEGGARPELAAAS